MLRKKGTEATWFIYNIVENEKTIGTEIILLETKD